MSKPFQAPETTVDLGGLPYQFRADLAAYMRVHELAVSMPEEFIPVVVNGEDVGTRMRMTPANAACYLEAFYAGGNQLDWPGILAYAHPMEVLAAWNAVNELLDKAESDWNPEKADSSPFRSEPE